MHDVRAAVVISVAGAVAVAAVGDGKLHSNGNLEINSLCCCAGLVRFTHAAALLAGKFHAAYSFPP